MSPCKVCAKWEKLRGKREKAQRAALKRCQAGAKHQRCMAPCKVCAKWEKLRGKREKVQRAALKRCQVPEVHGTVKGMREKGETARQERKSAAGGPQTGAWHRERYA